MIRGLRNQYYNPVLPESFSGSAAFFRALKERDINVNRHQISEFLKDEEAYTLHKPARRHFKRNKVIVSGIDDTWQIDLVDMRMHADVNDNFKYILTCIDVFSKQARAVAMKDKTGETTTLGMEYILNQTGRKPKNIQADKGSEFFNTRFDNLLKSKDINLYSVNSDVKACIVERFNRTLKEKMYRYFTHASHYRYIDVLEDFLESYNNSYHRTIKMAPVDVNENNQKEVWKNIYGVNENVSDDENAKYSKPEKVNFKFSIGDKVRLSKLKYTFEKGYTPNWTHEIFTIIERIC